LCFTRIGLSLSTAGQRPFSSANNSSLFHFLASQATLCVLMQHYRLPSAWFQLLCLVLPLSYQHPQAVASCPSHMQSLTTGLDPTRISGHSLRAGGATLAFQADLPEELIKRLGDWRSDAFRLYIHIPIKYRMHAIHQVAFFV